MNSNLDIWAVQDDASVIETALGQIKDGVSIIYDNCVCNMSIGSNQIHSREFNTVIYNEESDVIILVMKTSNVTKEDIVRYLSEKGLPFVEVTFMETDEQTDDLDVPEIWFAREQSVLEDAIKESVDKNILDCTYYPILEGNLRLGYINNDNALESVDGRLFKGLLEFEDKLVLMVNQSNNIDENGISRNITPDVVMNTCKKYSIEPYISMANDINLKKAVSGPKL